MKKEEKKDFEYELSAESNIWGSNVGGYLSRDNLTEEDLNVLENLLLEKQEWFVQNKTFIKENLKNFYECDIVTNQEIKEVLKKTKKKMPLPEPKLVKQKGKKEKGEK